MDFILINILSEMSFKKLEIDSTIVDEQEVSVLLDFPVHPSMRTKTKGKVEILHKVCD